MGDHTEEQAGPSKDLNHNTLGKALRPKDRFPPELSGRQKAFKWFVYGAALVAVLVVIDQLFFNKPLIFPFVSSCPCWVYIALGVFLINLYHICYFHHRSLVHEARLVDRSVVEGMIRDAKSAEPRLTEPAEKPDDFERKKAELIEEVDGLRTRGPETWTEYQVLLLDQKLIDFMKVDDLRAYAHSSLNTLSDYVQDVTYPTDISQYDGWKNRIETAIEKINKAKEPAIRDDAAELLRAEMRMILDDLADFDAYWAVGSIFRIWIIVGVVPFVVFLVMGLLPLLHPAGDSVLGIINWGLLGVAGALAAALHGVYKPDFVEVGYTEGKKDLTRAGLGVGLGFLAGLVTYAAISAGIVGIFKDRYVPDLQTPGWMQGGLSFLWAVAAGFFFEKIFAQVKTAVEKRLGMNTV
ncbi:MAG: hypothetical protein O7C75_05810 [Verrucomicrobia bacterium]|nr:hypothetical protein [Verrucomicrobiota bacterium]